jgi:hypothetical protein
MKALAVSLMEDKGLSVASTRRVMGYLGMMFDAAMEDGIIRYNPARGLKLKAPVAVARTTRKPKSHEFLAKIRSLQLQTR